MWKVEMSLLQTIKCHQSGAGESALLVICLQQHNYILSLRSRSEIVGQEGYKIPQILILHSVINWSPPQHVCETGKEDKFYNTYTPFLYLFSTKRFPCSSSLCVSPSPWPVGSRDKPRPAEQFTRHSVRRNMWRRARHSTTPSPGCPGRSALQCHIRTVRRFQEKYVKLNECYTKLEIGP